MKKLLYTYIPILVLSAATAGITLSAFTDKAAILGSSFSVGSADIKLLSNVAGGTAFENLVDSMPGPTFSNIVPNWEKDYLVKVYNNSASNVVLTSNSDYLTVNDPDDLRSVIYVEPFIWSDADGDGIVDDGELAANSLGKKTIVRWKTEGFDFGQLNSGEVKSFVLRFSTALLSEAKQGKSGTFDFEFNAVGL